MTKSLNRGVTFLDRYIERPLGGATLALSTTTGSEEEEIKKTCVAAAFAPRIYSIIGNK